MTLHPRHAMARLVRIAVPRSVNTVGWRLKIPASTWAITYRETAKLAPAATLFNDTAFTEIYTGS
eukprot:SAG22_NODE_6659_length_826_cov_0.792297_1_plen_64_part_10